MKKSTQLKLYIVLISLSFITLLVHYFNLKNELRECQQGNNFIQGGDILKSHTIDSLQNKCDSLYTELFPAQVQLNRYEIAYEIFLKRNPNAAKEYGTIISEETE
jgi:hypothetical protein